MRDDIQAIDCLCDDEIDEYEVLIALKHLFERICDKKEIHMESFQQEVSNRIKELKYEIGNRILMWYRENDKESNVLKELIR